MSAPAPLPDWPPAAWIALAYAAANLLAFALFVWDKAAAKRRVAPAGRVRERTLHLWAFAGGGIGAFAGLLLVRHKSRHTGFWLSASLALSAHVAVWALLIFG